MLANRGAKGEAVVIVKKGVSKTKPKALKRKDPHLRRESGWSINRTQKPM